MQSYFITDRNILNLTMVVTVGGAPVSKDTVSTYRPFYAFSFFDLKGMKFIPVSDKKLNGIIRRQKACRRAKMDYVVYEPSFPSSEFPTFRDRNPQAFSKKSTQFIINGLPQEISYSTACEILGKPTRKGRELIWPEATTDQKIVMAVIDMCHDRCNGAIYNGIITIGQEEIQIARLIKPKV